MSSRGRIARRLLGAEAMWLVCHRDWLNTSSPCVLPPTSPPVKAWKRSFWCPWKKKKNRPFSSKFHLLCLKQLPVEETICPDNPCATVLTTTIWNYPSGDFYGCFILPLGKDSGFNSLLLLPILCLTPGSTNSWSFFGKWQSGPSDFLLLFLIQSELFPLQCCTSVGASYHHGASRFLTSWSTDCCWRWHSWRSACWSRMCCMGSQTLGLRLSHQKGLHVLFISYS